MRAIVKCVGDNTAWAKLIATPTSACESRRRQATETSKRTKLSPRVTLGQRASQEWLGDRTSEDLTMGDFRCPRCDGDRFKIEGKAATTTRIVRNLMRL